MNKALPITQRVEPSDQKKFAKAMLDKNIEAFMIHISSLSLRLKMTIYLAKKAQIASLLVKKVTIILAKYLDFADAFSKKPAKILPE